MGLAPRIESIEDGNLTNGVKGRINGVAIPAGYVGERLTSGQQTNTLTTAQYDDTMSVTLTPGIWLITFRGEIDGSNTSGYYSMFVGTVAGNNSTGASAGVNFISMAGVTPSSGAQVAWCIGNYYVNITATTTYYGKVFQSSGTANAARGIIEGIRIA